jgi:ADP-heptose:LPS heptosyltransferase
MQPRKIIAIKLRSLGDTVLMTAPLNELRKAYPSAEIHVVADSRWTPLLETHPAIDRLWNYERYEDRAARAKAVARLALRLRKEKFDLAVNFHASPSSSLIAFSTGARQRAIHFHGHQHKNRYSTVEIPGKGIVKPIIERDMDTLRGLGLHIPAGRLPDLVMQPGEQLKSDERLSQAGRSQPVLGIGLGATRPTKCWPIERYAQLAIEWYRLEGGSTYAIAGPTEAAQAQAFLKEVDHLLPQMLPDAKARAEARAKISAIHTLSVRELASTLSRFAVFVGNDSGPRHVAIAVRVPTVTLFGPEDPYEWHPYPKERHPYFFIEGLPCRKDAAPGMPPWCGLHVCTQEEHRCLRQIGVEVVLQAAQKVALRHA